MIIFSIIFIPLQAIDNDYWQRPSQIPTPKDNPITPQKVELGKLLFFDKRLSRADDISCATCHDPKYGWADGVAQSVGDREQKGRRNSPTIINSAYLRSFFHDSRVTSLEEQALIPIETDVEMNIPLEVLIKKLNAIDGYKKLFLEVFGDAEINKENLAKAIATFERTIVSSQTDFQKWNNGEKNAMNQAQIDGFNIFKDSGKCISCHNNFNFTNERFANIGLGDENDLGVYEVSETKNKIWKANFKTPTLINIEKTAPYFHNGSVKTLKEAVHICGNGGKKPVKSRSPFFRDRKVSNQEVNLIVEFLKALTPPEIKVEIPTDFPQ
ncbi:MAG: c-type cytochrome [Sulfurimonas sp.]|nr:c-type cytochrome [Sulfurimonas sp.]